MDDEDRQRETSSGAIMDDCTCGDSQVTHRKLQRTRSTRKGHRTDEEHWKKVLQANEKTTFYDESCNFRGLGRFRSFRRRNKTHKNIANEETQTVASSMMRRFYCWLNARFTEERNSPKTSQVKSENVCQGPTSDSRCGSDPLRASGVLIYTNNRIAIDSVSISESDDSNYVYFRNETPHDRNQDTCNFCSTSTNRLQVPSVFPENSSSDKLKPSSDQDDRRLPLTSTKSCPSHSALRPSVCKQDNFHLHRTWPLSRKQFFSSYKHEDEVFDSVFEDAAYIGTDSEKRIGDFNKDVTKKLRDVLGSGKIRISQCESENPETLGEFSIPHSDLEFGDCVRQGRNCDIFRGKWHGEMDIHYFGALDDNKCKEFWKTVTKLRRIRHENAALFMGACVDPQHLSIVQSVEGGSSLYDQIHIKKIKFTLRSKVQFLSQISNGMGYLHAKGIVLKHLSTRNIFLCSKARISVMDYGFPEKHHNRPGYTTVPRGSITYIAPEILLTLKVVPPTFVMDYGYDREADVYAFGTIIFELLSCKYPFDGVDTEVFIYHVCKGYRQDMNKISGTKSLKVLAERCWSQNKKERPIFIDISRELSSSPISSKWDKLKLLQGFLHKRHSSSEPENLHRCSNGQSYI